MDILHASVLVGVFDPEAVVGPVPPGVEIGVVATACACEQGPGRRAPGDEGLKP